MNESWYVVQGGSAQGPFDAATMASMAANGILRADTQVCRVGEQAWRPAASDPSLGALLGVPAAEVPGTWSFGAGWQATMVGFKRSWGPLILVGLVAFGLALPAALLNQILSVVTQNSRDTAVILIAGLVSLVVSIANWLFVTIPVQNAALPYAASKAASGGIRVGDLFQGYRRLGMVLATGVVLSVAVGLAVVVALVPGVIAIAMGVLQKSDSPAAVPLIVIGALLVLALVLAVFWLAMPYMFAPAVACDPAFGRQDFAACFRLSAQGIKGRALSVLGFLIVIGLLAAASVLLLCLGYLLVGVPLMLAGYGAVYAICVRSRAPHPGAS